MIGRAVGISYERVRQILKRMDPSWTPVRTPRPEPEIRYCILHPHKALYNGRRRYCSAEEALAVRRLRELTSYRLGHLRIVARKEGRKGVRPQTLQHQVLHRSSKAYKMLKKYGLLGQLPARVEIRP